MITLYHAPKSRSTRMIFLLEELGVPYEIKIVSIRRGDGSGAADASNPHPHAKVPAIRNGSETVFESSAIVAYLTDTFPQAGLAPKAGEAGRGQYLTMLAYYGDVVEPSFVSKFLKMEVPRGTAGWVAMEEVMEYIDKTLTAHSYIAGDKFTGADILYATTFGMFAQNPMMPKLASVEAYVKRCLERPAYARAMSKDSRLMGEIANLRRARKARTRDEKEKAAEANRILHGTPKPLRDLAKAKTAKAVRELDAHKKD